jgi:hypothetical protein
LAFGLNGVQHSLQGQQQPKVLKIYASPLFLTFGMLGPSLVVGLWPFYSSTKRQVTIKQFAMSTLLGLCNYKRKCFHDLIKKYRLCMYYTQIGILGQILAITWQA